MSTVRSDLSRRSFLGCSAGALLASSFAPFAPPLAASSSPRRIILDCDTGVDDAIAILLALRSPELKIEAITAVSGNVPLALTLPNTLRMVEIAGRGDVPVAGGAAIPLVRQLVTASYVHGENGLGGAEFPEPKLKPVDEPAAQLIRRIVHSRPGEVTIVGVGPLTNVALALKSDPELGSQIQEIVVMGGSLTGGNITPSAEFNFYVDPEAARVMFDSGVPLTMVGLNVTQKVLLGEQQLGVLEAAQNPVSQAAGKILRSTIEHIREGRGITAKTMAMHDPLTVAHLIDPSILTLKDYYVQIETSGEFSAGESVAYEHPPARESAPMNLGPAARETRAQEFKANAKVAVGVDPDKFFQLLLQRITRES
ncbi:MAG TPA: nucleoside hydrolase [Candidatus Eremiobacteraceae bacterium]|nr:nucleoside hydrolase [Candidatus Eremiobacteraceae bacterium]